MRKTLIITFNGEHERLANSLKMKSSEVFKKLTVLPYGNDTDEWIRKERPEVIIINNGLPHRDLQMINLEIGDTLGRYDIACSLFLINSSMPLLSGVINVESIEDAIAWPKAGEKI
jgi:hypothetical protein